LAQKKISIHASKMFDQEFYMWNPHFLIDELNKSIFHKNLNIFFSIYLHTHANNTLLIDDTPLKACSMAHTVQFFWSCFMTIMRKINICYGLLSFIWKIFFRLDMVFPPLLNTIPLVGLDVLIEIIQDFLKCYLWNIIGPTNPLFVIVRS
jgi:hypothetical protein